MGTGCAVKRKGGGRSRADKRSFRRTFMDLKTRTKDIDQIQDELTMIASGKELRGIVDEDAPGGGRFYCVPCARHFISGEVLAEHERTKVHKRRVKEVAEPQYTHREAEAAAGMSAPDTAV